jgi:glycosyltransferase involved in cell wall biosynthesis
MNYVLITPARNEAANIERTIHCVIAQTLRPVRWLIVNDGSNDATADIVRKYLQEHSWIELVDMPHHRDRSFAAKAHCFNAGYERVKPLAFDVIGNLDADLSFEPDYFEFLMRKFTDDPTIGVAGTIFREDGYSSETNSFEGEQHVAGGARCSGDIVSRPWAGTCRTKLAGSTGSRLLPLGCWDGRRAHIGSAPSSTIVVWGLPNVAVWPQRSLTVKRTTISATRPPGRSSE